MKGWFMKMINATQTAESLGEAVARRVNRLTSAYDVTIDAGILTLSSKGSKVVLVAYDFVEKTELIGKLNHVGLDDLRSLTK